VRFGTFFIRLGIGLGDMLLLTTGLLYIYFGTSPTGGLRIFATNAFIIFIVVVVLYLIIVAISSLFLTTMRQDSWAARIAKSIVSTIIVVALFSWFLVPVLWVFGYDLNADVDIRNTLIIISIVRTLFKIWAGRRFGGATSNE